MMYRLRLAFCPNQSNIQRPSGKGVWRVARCWEVGQWFPVKVAPGPSAADDPQRKYLYINAARMFKLGSRVNPRTILLEAYGGAPGGGKSNKQVLQWLLSTSH